MDGLTQYNARLDPLFPSSRLDLGRFVATRGNQEREFPGADPSRESREESGS